MHQPVIFVPVNNIVNLWAEVKDILKTKYEIILTICSELQN